MEKRQFNWYNSALITLFTLFFLTTTYSQSDKFYFVSITKQQGLPDNSIYHIFQDNKGLIWLCTGRGLVNYDGNSFKHFLKDEASTQKSINSSRVTHIMQSKKGNFWISTSDNGLNIYDPEIESFTYFKHQDDVPQSIGNNNINSCFEDSKGRIWICTLGAGLDLYDPITNCFKHYQHSNSDSSSIPDNQVTAIVEDVYGMLWVATDGNNISEFNPETGRFVNYKSSFSGVNLGGFFKSLLFSNDSTLWIATDGTGLFKFNTKTHQFKRFYQDFKPESINSNNLKGLLTDNAGNLLIVTDGGGINKMNLKTETFDFITYDFNTRNGITTNALYSIVRDKQNNIWIGTYKTGLLLLKENTRTIGIVSQNKGNSGLNHKSVLSIFKDSKGLTWYGTDGGGLNCYNPTTGKFKYFQFDPNNANSISSDVVKDIHEDANGNLWVATFFGGLNKFERTSQKFYRYQLSSQSQKSISSINSWCIMEDLDKNLWIGNFSSGLDHFDLKTETFTHIPQVYRDSSTLSHVQVSSLVQDVNGDIWAGTLGGLNQLDYKTHKCRRYYHNPNDPNSLSDDVITALFYDSKHRLWIGSDGGGINLMIKPGIFKSYGKTGELPSLAIQSIEEDANGCLWISTKNGLVKFDPATESFYNMDDAEDFLSNEFNWNSSNKDSDGNLYFGTVDGVCSFNPSQIVFHKSFPNLLFTNIKAFNKSIEVGKSYHGRVLIEKSISNGGQVKLTSNENAFTIDFAAIEFNKPAKIKYKYKLQGFDNEWLYANALQRSATYTNLSGGEYTFYLTSTNSAGVWNSDFITLNITIIPPFYQQWWFRLFLIAVVLSLVYILYKRSIEKHKRKIRENALTREKEFIERRNEELKSEIASNTLLLLNKNESLEQIKVKLEELNNVSHSNANIGELISMVDNEMEADLYWEQFEYNFDQVYRNLLTRLLAKYPDLTRTNLKLCAYLRLNMSSKEIASLMNITPSGIDKARNRLRKKLNIQPNEDLHEFLMNF